MMINLTDCMRAVSGALEREFGAAPVTKDIREGFPRPATFLHAADVTSSMEGLVRHDIYRFEITRFSRDDEQGYLDLIVYQERLRRLLSKPIPVTGAFWLYPDEVDFEIVMSDYALVAGFEAENYQVDPKAAEGTGETMRILYENGQCVVRPDEEEEE